MYEFVLGGFFGDLLNEALLEGFCIECRDRLSWRCIHLALWLVIRVGGEDVASLSQIGWC